MSKLRRPRRPRASYANLTATLALVVAVGTGAAYAAGLGRNVVKSRNIAPRAVKSSDLGKRAVRTAKIAPRAVTGNRIAKDTVVGANIDEATLGTVPNAGLLDGLDSSALLHGAGRTYGVLGSDPEGGSPSVPVDLDVGGSLTFACENPASLGSDLRFTNSSGGSAEVWTDKIQEGFPPPTTEGHVVVGNGESATLSVSGPVVASGSALLRMTIVAGSRLTLVEARIGHAPGACRFPLLITELRG
jgi:hypothetical protein